MYKIEPGFNPLRINMILHDLAIEYGIKDFKIRGYWNDNIYMVTLKYYHTIKGKIVNLRFAVTKQVLSTERWMDSYSQCQHVIKMRTQRMRQAIIDLIMKCGSVQ